MKKRISIGEFAKISGVSIKSLRYYEKMGILTPNYVNTETNYRYYSIEQISEVEIIYFFINTGIPLKELHNFKLNDGTFDFKSLIPIAKINLSEKIKKLEKSFSLVTDLENQMTMIENVKNNIKNQNISKRKIFTKEISLDNLNIESATSIMAELYVSITQQSIIPFQKGGILYKCDVNKYFMFIEIPNNTKKSSDIQIIPKGNFLIELIETDLFDDLISQIINHKKDQDIIYEIDFLLSKNFLTLKQLMVLD